MTAPAAAVSRDGRRPKSAVTDQGKLLSPRFVAAPPGEPPKTSLNQQQQRLLRYPRSGSRQSTGRRRSQSLTSTAAGSAGTTDGLEAVVRELFEIPPDPALRTQFTAAWRVDTSVQNVPSLTEHATNTDRGPPLASHGMRHVEGGWPKDVDATDVMQLQRHIKKIEREECYFAAVAALSAKARTLVSINAAIDIYNDYDFNDEPSRLAVQSEGYSPSGMSSSRNDDLLSAATITDPAVEVRTRRGGVSPPPPSQPSSEMDTSTLPPVRAVQFGANAAGSFGNDDDDDHSTIPHRGVAAMSWTPFDASRSPRLVVAFSFHCAGTAGSGAFFAAQQRRQQNARLMIEADMCAGGTLCQATEPCDAYVFDVARPTVPELVLCPPSSLTAVEYHPRDAHVIAAATATGAVVHFDTRRGGRPVMVASAGSHRQAPGNVFTSSSSVHSSAWAARHSASAATHIKWLQASGKAAEFAVADGSSQVLVWDVRALERPVDTVATAMKVTESESFRHGVVCLDYSASTPSTGRIYAGTTTGCVFALSRRGKGEQVVGVHGSHSGPLLRVARHPTHHGLMASAADRAVRVWLDDRVEAVGSITDAAGHERVVDCAWHPLVPTILMVLYVSGRLSIWRIALTGGSNPGGWALAATLQVLPVGGRSYAASLAVSPDGSVACVGSANGVVELVSLPHFAHDRPMALPRRDQGAEVGGVDTGVGGESPSAASADHDASLGTWANQLRQRALGLSDTLRGGSDRGGVSLLGAQANRALLADAAVLLRASQGSSVAGLTADDERFDDIAAPAALGVDSTRQHRHRRTAATRAFVGWNDDLVGESVWASPATLTAESQRVTAEFSDALVNSSPVAGDDEISLSWSATVVAARATLDSHEDIA